MNWKDIAGKVAGFAPLIGGALAGPAGSAAGKVLASALDTNDDPDAISSAIAQDPQAAAKIRQAELDNKIQLQQILLQGRQAEMQADTANIAQVNETMRAEIAQSGGKWRTAVGWGMAINFFLITCALCYAVIADPTQLPAAVSGVMTIAIAQGAVMGVQIHKDSQTKQTAITGLPQSGILGGLLKR